MRLQGQTLHRATAGIAWFGDCCHLGLGTKYTAASLRCINRVCEQHTQGAGNQPLQGIDVWRGRARPFLGIPFPARY